MGQLTTPADREDLYFSELQIRNRSIRLIDSLLRDPALSIGAKELLLRAKVHVHKRFLYLVNKWFWEWLT